MATHPNQTLMTVILIDRYGNARILPSSFGLAPLDALTITDVQWRLSSTSLNLEPTEPP